MVTQPTSAAAYVVNSLLTVVIPNTLSITGVACVEFLIDEMVSAAAEKREAAQKKGRQHLPENAYLILDDFMPRGNTGVDESLLRLLKTLIRNKPIVVVVLTASKGSANTDGSRSQAPDPGLLACDECCG